MRIVGGLLLKEAAQKYKDAANALTMWRAKVVAARWGSFVELKADFRSADYIQPFTVFDIRGNRYRLIAIVDFVEKIVVVRGVLTHAEYDRGNWK